MLKYSHLYKKNKLRKYIYSRRKRRPLELHETFHMHLLCISSVHKFRTHFSKYFVLFGVYGSLEKKGHKVKKKKKEL